MRKLFAMFGFVVAAATATTASADIYSDCVAAIDANDLEQVERLASTMMRFNNIPAPKLTDANSCVSAAVNVPMAFYQGSQSFVPQAELAAQEEAKLAARKEAELAAQKEAEARREEAEKEAEAVRVRVCELQDVVTETQQTIRQAEAAQQDRRIETLAATIRECSIWFEDDARGALTNDVCNSIFASGGLPNSEVSGPTTSEVLLAEIINTNAETELRILVESGMLLSTIAAKALELGLLEDDDPYDCRE